MPLPLSALMYVRGEIMWTLINFAKFAVLRLLIAVRAIM